MEKEIRMKKYQEVDKNFQELFSSDKAMMLHFGIVTKYSIKNKDIYIELIGDTILGFHHTKDLPQLLQKEVGLSADEAQRVVADLAEFLSPVLEREAAAASAKKQELQALGSTIGNRSIPTSNNQGSIETPPANEHSKETDHMDSPDQTTISTKSEPLDEVQPMRTMKGDMQRIHGYGAYRDAHPDQSVDDEPTIRSHQDDVLTEKPRLADTPRVGD